jgi:hypothetical protein
MSDCGYLTFSWMMAWHFIRNYDYFLSLVFVTDEEMPQTIPYLPGILLEICNIIETRET